MEEYHTEVLVSDPLHPFVQLTAADGDTMTIRVDQILMIDQDRSGHALVWINIGIGHGYTMKRVVQESVSVVLDKMGEAISAVIETPAEHDVVHGRSWARDWGKE